jgi:hypothetical protein
MKRSTAPPNEVRWPKRIETLAEARKYIDAIGFCALFSVRNAALPSLYWPMSHRGPDDDFIFDKYFERIWKWKDELPRRGYALYAKYFRSRGTLISLAYLPYFLAMREAAVAPDDHARFYADGRIRDDARAIWEALAENGPLATLELRHLCHMETKAGNVRFKRAIVDLQCLLVVGHFGSEQETGAWESTRFELTCRAFPKQTALARDIEPDVARAKIAAKYLEWQAAAAPLQLSRLFGWSKDETAAAIDAARAVAPIRKGRKRA